ncbi:MAG: tetratricopeptide repeat protein [Paludibacter sp.]|nr:tetratricopeptide repeat protein [Paludibacter sp.]
MKKIKYTLYITFIFLAACGTSKKVGIQEASRSVLTEEEQLQFDFNFYEGLRLKEEGLLTEAFDSFIACKKIDSLDAGLLVEIAFMHLSAGKQDEAMKSMEQALSLEPENWWYNTILISLYIEQKKYPEAIEIGEDLLKKHPNKEEVYHILIPLYKQTTQYKKAISLYDKLERIAGINERIIFDKTRLYMMLDDPKKANIEIEKLIEKFPRDNKYKILKGDMLIQQGKLLQAYDLYQLILKEDPQNPYVYISLSDYYKAVDNPEKALEYIILALKNGQLDMTIKFEILGQHIESLIRDDKKIDEIESLFTLLIEYYPLEEGAHSYYASFLQYLKRDDEAAMAYESMLNINPRNVQTWFSLMQISFAKKDYDAVIQIADRAIEATEDNPSIYYYKGITLELMELYDEAMLTHTKALSFFKPGENHGLQSDIYAHLGNLYMKQENTQAAFLAYDEAIKYNPNNLIALNNFAYYLSLEKNDLQKAERMSAKTVEKEPRNSTYLDTYAWIFYQQGNYSLAKFYIERAVDNLKDAQEPGVILDHYGDILWMSGNNDTKALEVWEKAYNSGYQTDELKEKIENHGWER